jgi:Ala-tRNA(Pro) deacylase
MTQVLEYLQGRGQVFTVIPHPKASHASATMIPAELLVRTVVAIANHGPTVLVIPASETLDLDRLGEAIGDPEARLASEFELRRQFPDYEVGTLPPLSMLLLAPMYVDPAVVERDEVVFAAGRADLSIRMSTADLFGGDPVVITPLTTAHRAAAPTA